MLHNNEIIVIICYAEHLFVIRNAMLLFKILFIANNNIDKIHFYLLYTVCICISVWQANKVHLIEDVCLKTINILFLCNSSFKMDFVKHN